MPTQVVQFEWRQGTAATWTSTNRVLALGEPGYETDTGKWKLGNGSTAWVSLAYQPNSVTVQGAGGNLGATQTVNFASAIQEIWLPGTLNANLTVILSNRVAGCKAVLQLVQDGTGSRTLTISDGTNTAAVTIDPTAGNPSVVEVFCPNSTDLYVNP